jgi:FAD/FMN-containing dehydrogenase
MQSYFANRSCSPFLDRSIPCTLGNYVSYAVNVSTAAHVASTIKFATQYNIRFIVRNTGHE